MAFTFKKATKLEAKGRIALTGPSGAGKTLTALKFARVLAGPTGRIAVIDTEKGSASKYSDKFDFDVLELTSFAPLTYVEAIHAAEAEGYDVIVVDSLTHAWSGKDGAMEQVDKIKARSRGGDGNGFTAWKDVTPMHNALIDAMTGSTAHVVATMRSKMEYVIEEDSRGKKVPRKVGMAPEQRAGMEYEFDLVGDMDQDHRLVVSKSRCDELADAVVMKPGPETAEAFKAWLSGAPRPAPASNATSSGPAPIAEPPAALAPLYAALPGVADPNAAAALWFQHRPAIEAADEAAQKAARSAMVRRIVAFGGGVGTPDAARKFLTRALTELDAKASAAEESPAAPAPAQAAPAEPGAVDPAPAAEPEVHTPAEAPAVETSPETQPAQHPALGAFYARVEEIELPGESVAVWMKYRAELAALPVSDREAAWLALCTRTEAAGRMKNAKVWLKRAIAEEDARKGFPGGSQTANQPDEPANEGLPADVLDALLADLGMARDATVLAQVWAAVAEKEWHDATPAQRVRLENARTAREKALRTPPQPPKGTRPRATPAPADASGSGAESAANDGAGATMSTADRWRAHLAAKPRAGKLCGAGGVAASWVKHRDELTEAGARAECLAITIDELAARGVTEPGAWIDGVREHLAAKAA